MLLLNLLLTCQQAQQQPGLQGNVWACQLAAAASRPHRVDGVPLPADHIAFDRYCRKNLDKGGSKLCTLHKVGLLWRQLWRQSAALPHQLQVGGVVAMQQPAFLLRTQQATSNTTHSATIVTLHQCLDLGQPVCSLCLVLHAVSAEGPMSNVQQNQCRCTVTGCKHEILTMYTCTVQQAC